MSDLSDLLSAAWDRIDAGVRSPANAARLLTLSTIGPDGGPEARTVVLRRADRAAGLVEVHTDLYSAKVADLRADNRAALTVWDAEVALQLRLTATVEVRTGAEVSDIWTRVPEASRKGYGAEPAPGTPITGPEEYEKTSDPAAFAVLTCRLTRMDVVHLGPTHRRALFRAEDGWHGQWLAP